MVAASLAIGTEGESEDGAMQAFYNFQDNLMGQKPWNWKTLCQLLVGGYNFSFCLKQQRLWDSCCMDPLQVHCGQAGVSEEEEVRH